MAKKVINDFSGGITDFTDSAKENQCEICDNLVIQKDRTLSTRPGIDLVDSNNAQPSGSTDRVDHIFDFNGEVYTQSAKKVGTA